MMGARRRKINQQAAAGLDTSGDYFDTDRIVNAPAERDRAWYYLVVSLVISLVVSASLTVWAILYVVHRALKL